MAKNEQVTARAKAAPKDAPKKGKSKRSMQIEQADDGGFMSTTYNHGAEAGMASDQPYKCIHKNANALAKHVKSTFGGGSEGGEDYEKGEEG